MDRLAGNYLSNGDVANASSLYNSLEKLSPIKYSRMARMCRVLSDPQRVPLPVRYEDICDALLDPAVPPELLVRSSAADVQKAFQRLAVCVHPDKNPNVRAKDAFLRLTHMKDMALQALWDRTSAANYCNGEDTSAAATQPKATAAAAPVVINVMRRPQRPTLPGTSSSGGAPLKTRNLRHGTPPLTPVTRRSASGGSFASNLDHLRQTTITLNCFKRRDIAEDFEIFSATQRPGGGGVSGGSSSITGLDDCKVEHLAATVPVLPKEKQAPLHRRRQPPLPGRSATARKKAADGPHPLATPLHVPSSNTSATTTTTASPCGPSPLTSPIVAQTQPFQPQQQQQPSLTTLTATIAQQPAADGVGSSGSSPPPGAVLQPLPGSLTHGDADNDDGDAVRQQIDQTCMLLRQMRTYNTNIKLSLDLSFEAYQRSRELP